MGSEKVTVNSSALCTEFRIFLYYGVEGEDISQTQRIWSTGFRENSVMTRKDKDALIRIVCNWSGMTESGRELKSRDQRRYADAIRSYKSH